MTTAELIRGFESRQITPYTEVRKQGEEGWTQIGNVPHLVHAISTVVRRRNSTPPPPLAAPPLAAPPLAAPLAALAPAAFAPAAAPYAAVAPAPHAAESSPVQLIPRAPRAASQLLLSGETDIQITPSTRSTSTVTPVTMTAPNGSVLSDAAILTASTKATRPVWHFALGGAAAAGLLFVAFSRFGGSSSAQSSASAADPTATHAAPAAQPAAAPQAAAPLVAAPLAAAPLAVAQPNSAAAPANAKTSTVAANPGSAKPSTVAAANTAAPAKILSFDSLAPADSHSGASAAANIATAAAAAPTRPSDSSGSGQATSSSHALVAPPSGQANAAPEQPPHVPGEFDNAAARTALSAASQRAQGCLGLGMIHTAGKVVVMFDPSGAASNVSILTPEYAQPPLGPCLTNAFKQATVPSFLGAPVAVSKTFTAH
ncbi:MAG TPA: DUF4339 domain-containing protein [Polyangiaceae bacterium]|nr:DUF4339 domain-containing protein [Polyangiaceae bacterium]